MSVDTTTIGTEGDVDREPGSGSAPFAGKVALVTGGATGIGRAAALGFAARGAAVVVADVNDGAGEATAKDIRAGGGEARYVHADVTSADDAQEMVTTAVDAFGGLDLAFNNAGMSGRPGGIVDCPLDQWHSTLALNLTGVFLSMRAEVPALLARGGGAIVNTSSGAGLIGFADLPAYVASKHGVVGLTKAVALELGPRGVRVNAVCPGTTRTPMIEAYIGGDPAMEAAMSATSPIGRMADPAEIAAAAVWLCSDEASFVNGVALPVDAGAVAQ
jgi:NAD(P)-dependent dehydrogenase (short-subunit alcohol dehydrogenase family)